jgi:ribonuclease HI
MFNITLNRESRLQNPVFIEAEIRALIHENSSENVYNIYIDGSVLRHAQSSWAFTAQARGRTMHKDSGIFYHTSSSITMEVMALTKVLSWLETQAFRNLFFLSDSMSTLGKIEAGWKHWEWLESLRQSIFVCIVIFLVPCHAGVKETERAVRLVGTAVISYGRAID